MYNNYLIFLCLSSIILCEAVRQQITLYKGQNQTGDGLILTSKPTDLMALAPTIIPEVKSYCVLGWWRFFSYPNYQCRPGEYGTEFGTTETVFCNDIHTLSENTASARCSGPPDTDTQAMTLYSDKVLCGQEDIIEDAISNISTPPQSLFVTGFSNWTFYSGGNFDGTSTCYISTRKVHYAYEVNATISSVGSIVRGCYNGNQEQKFIYLEDLERANSELLHNL